MASLNWLNDVTTKIADSYTSKVGHFTGVTAPETQDVARLVCGHLWITALTHQRED